MKKILFLLLGVLLFGSCKPDPKSYKVVVHCLDSKGNESVISDIFQEYSDSSAHLKSLDFFVDKVESYYVNAVVSGDTLLERRPLSYSLFNEQRDDITAKTFSTYELIRQNQYGPMIESARNYYLSRIEEKREQAALEAEVQKDRQATIRKAKQYFRYKKDEFDNLTWVKPKSAPYYLNRNGIYCYFQVVNDVASNFRLRIQYTADNWLFIRSYQFLIDGRTYQYTPSEVERDNKSTIWEWSDESVSNFDLALINALYSAKTAKIRYVGSQYHKDRTISATELASIRRAYDLYLAMGGRIH